MVGQIRKWDSNWRRNNHQKTNDYMKAEGYVCVTNQNFGRKHDERVFFVPKVGSVKIETLQNEWLTDWNHLIENCQTTHQRDIDTRKKRDRHLTLFSVPIRAGTAWSRHVYERLICKTRGGDLCYARVDHKGDIAGLYPVMISRELARKIPRDLVPAHLLTAEEFDKLSAADRVFGWVRQGKGDTQDAHARNAYKGHFRIRKITCETSSHDAVHTFNGDGLPLAILFYTETSQALFYAAGARTYDVAKKLSGRKFYPHQPDVPACYWIQAAR